MTGYQQKDNEEFETFSHLKRAWRQKFSTGKKWGIKAEETLVLRAWMIRAQVFSTNSLIISHSSKDSTLCLCTFPD